MIKNPNKIYLFFENHQRTGFAWLFAKWTESDAKRLQHKNNWKTSPCNHMGFVFFDRGWQVAELDYFAGGRIIRNLTKKEEEKFQLFAVADATDSTLFNAIRDHFMDLYRKKKFWYSLRRYNFQDCRQYLFNRTSSRVKYSKTRDMIAKVTLQFLHWVQTAINYYRGQPQNSGFTCVKSVFLVLEKAGVHIFPSERPPYELMQVLDTSSN
jgi:hypothetical protein